MASTTGTKGFLALQTVNENTLLEFSDKDRLEEKQGCTQEKYCKIFLEQVAKDRGNYINLIAYFYQSLIVVSVKLGT